MALEVVWSAEAEEQLDEIITYLEKHWSEKEIGNFFNRLEEAVLQISNTPQRFKRSQRKSEAREYQLSPQTTLFYSYTETRVEILLLWLNRRNPENIG